MKIENCNLIILSFFITAFWDLLLQVVTYNWDRLPEFMKWFGFIKSLQPYFKRHTILAAALLAGFVGALTQYIILKMHRIPTNINTFISFMTITFIVSALIGIPMQYSKLFPILDETYYKYLGPYKSLYHDGISGIIVQITLLCILYGYKFIKRRHSK